MDTWHGARCAVWGLAMWAVCASQAYAQDDGYVARTVVDANALSNVQGAIGVNMAAGDFNLQFNGAAIALNADQRGRGVAQVGALQAAGVNQGVMPDVAVIRVGGDAFANVRGVLSLNQASGLGNAQANGVAILLGVHAEDLAEVDLAQAVAMPGPNAAADAGRKGQRSISVAETAFRGARGIIQVNQSAGSGNATANSFAMRIMVGTGN